MNLINLRLSQIEPSTDSEIALRSQSDGVSSNVDSFAEYANSTFTTGGYSNSVVLSESIKYLSSTNANSAYADSNSFVLGSAVNSRDNLLVYLDGILQHTDQYTVEGTSLTLSNTDPLPKDISVGIRHLQTSNVLVTASAGANSTAASNGTIAWDYETKRLYVYDGSTIGGYASNTATQSVVVSPSAQGSISGYSSGGTPDGTNRVNTIDKFSFIADAGATDVGDLTGVRSDISGQSSSISGYTVGGTAPAPFGQPIPYLNVIDKFPFSSDTNATDVGDLTAARVRPSGNESEESGYTVSGNDVTDIDKFPFAADANATVVGDLTQSRGAGAGQSSTTFGYTSGGSAPPFTNVIDKFPFTSDTNATDVGDLTQARFNTTGQSSSISGYTSGGSTPSDTNVIDKFPFAADGNATDVGDLTQARRGTAGQSSVVSGYNSGGDGPVDRITIDKFPFASDGNATDVGDLTQAREFMAGQQV